MNTGKLPWATAVPCPPLELGYQMSKVTALFLDASCQVSLRFPSAKGCDHDSEENETQKKSTAVEKDFFMEFMGKNGLNDIRANLHADNAGVHTA